MVSIHRDYSRSGRIKAFLFGEPRMQVDPSINYPEEEEDGVEDFPLDEEPEEIEEQE